MAEFLLGFAALAEMIPDVVGTPKEDEHWEANGDSQQVTTGGLLVWRKADNWTAFTDGHTTWINGPNGLESRLNSERFPWELGPSLVPRDVSALLPTAPKNKATRYIEDMDMICVHWDGVGNLAGYDPLDWYTWEARYHIAKNWAGPGEKPAYGYGLMYHECLSQDGRLWITRPAYHQVWACMSANYRTYNLKVDGSPTSPPTAVQLAALPRRLDALREQYGIKRAMVYGHGELTLYGNSTSCPGEDVLRVVQAYRTA